jgi:hypothetical protein
VILKSESGSLKSGFPGSGKKITNDQLSAVGNVFKAINNNNNNNKVKTG